MPLKMKELPEKERPYEKLKMYGASKLSNAELLAIIIKTGTKDENSIDIANRILLLVNKIADLQNLSIQDLEAVKGIGEVKAIQIKAVCELTKRILDTNNNINVQIKEPKDIAIILMNELMTEKQEILKVAILNSKNILLKVTTVVIGETNFANVTIKQILVEIIKMQAPKMILIHNHPSGDPTPSNSDLELTMRTYKICKTLGIKLLDHIIIGNNTYESILSRRDFKNEIMGL